MQPGSQPQHQTPPAVSTEGAALHPEVLRAERPGRYFGADLASLVADRFLAERSSLFRSCAMVLYPDSDTVWSKFAPAYSDCFEEARNRTCDAIAEMERAALSYESRKAAGQIVNPAQLLDTVDRGLQSIKQAMILAEKASMMVAKDFGNLSEESPNQVVLFEGAPLTVDAVRENGLIREDKTRRFFGSINAWASSFQLGALEHSKPEVVNLNAIAAPFCAGRYAVSFAEQDYHIRVDPAVAEFLVASVSGHFIQSVSRSVGKIVDTTLAKPEFWKMGDAEFNRSAELRDLKAAMQLVPETRIEVDGPSHISIRLEIHAVIKGAMRTEMPWLAHEISVLERFANSKGVGFERTIDPDKGSVEVRLLFHRIAPGEVPARELPESPVVPLDGSPVSHELTPFEHHRIEFQRRCQRAGGNVSTPTVTIPAEALLSSRARYTIGEMLTAIDEAVAAFPEISQVFLQGKSRDQSLVRQDFEAANAVATITGFRGIPEFNPHATRFSELWCDYPWEASRSARGETGPGPRPSEAVPETTNSDSITIFADASMLLWHRDIWARALKLGQRCNVSFLDLGAIPSQAIDDKTLPHHRTPMLLLESLEPKIDLYRKELGHGDFYLTIAALDSGRRYEDHITHSVQFATDNGVTARAVFDRAASGFRMYPHSEEFVEHAAAAVWTALSVLPDEKRHRVLSVAEALSKGSIRYHEQLLLELVNAVPATPLSNAEEYREIVLSTVRRFLSDPVTSVEIGKGPVQIRFLGELSSPA